MDIKFYKGVSMAFGISNGVIPVMVTASGDIVSVIRIDDWERTLPIHWTWRCREKGLLIKWVNKKDFEQCLKRTGGRDAEHQMKLSLPADRRLSTRIIDKILEITNRRI